MRCCRQSLSKPEVHLFHFQAWSFLLSCERTNKSVLNVSSARSFDLLLVPVHIAKRYHSTSVCRQAQCSSIEQRLRAPSLLLEWPDGSRSSRRAEQHKHQLAEKHFWPGVVNKMNHDERVDITRQSVTKVAAEIKRDQIAITRLTIDRAWATSLTSWTIITLLHLYISMGDDAGPSAQPPPPEVVRFGDTSRRLRAYTPRAPLVSQVDASDLDNGIVDLLADGVERTLSRFKVGWIRSY